MERGLSRTREEPNQEPPGPILRGPEVPRIEDLFANGVPRDLSASLDQGASTPASSGRPKPDDLFQDKGARTTSPDVRKDVVQDQVPSLTVGVGCTLARHGVGLTRESGHVKVNPRDSGVLAGGDIRIAVIHSN